MDVTVFGLVAGTHVIEDIQMDVPHGQTVTIPADKAARSKDLWRAISSKQLFQVRAGPHLPRPIEPNVNTTERDLRAQIERLEIENADLRRRLDTERATHQAALAEQQSKLDVILGLLQKGVVAMPQVVMAGAPGAIKTDGVVADDVPAFIPSAITPENVQARIEAKKDEAENRVSGAAGKLRELRQKPKQ